MLYKAFAELDIFLPSQPGVENRYMMIVIWYDMIWYDILSKNKSGTINSAWIDRMVGEYLQIEEGIS